MNSARFNIDYPPDSFAERHLGDIENRLNTALDAFSSLFNCTAPSDVIHVQITGGVEPRSTELIDYQANSLLVEYHPENPGIEMEKNLARLLLAGLVGSGSLSMPFINTGVIAWVGAMLSSESLSVAEPDEGKKRPPVKKIVSADYRKENETDIVNALLLTDFLMNRYGAASVVDFLRILPKMPLAQAIKQSFAVSIKILDRLWRKPARVNVVKRFARTAYPYLRQHKQKLAELLVYLLIAVAFDVTLPLRRCG